MREHRPERPNHHRPTDRPDNQPTTPNRPEGPRPRHQRARTPEPARPNPPAPHQAPNTAPPNPDHPTRPHTKTPTQAEEAIRRQSGDCLRSFTPGFAQGYCLSLALRGAGYPWTQKTKHPGGGRCSPGIVGWPMFPHPWHKIFDIQQDRARPQTPPQHSEAPEARTRVLPLEDHGKALLEHRATGTFGLELAGSQNRVFGKLGPNAPGHFAPSAADSL